MPVRQWIFTPLFVLAVILFLQALAARLRLVALGRPAERNDRPLLRLLGVVRHAFAQQRVTARPYGIVHFLLFWSFVVLLLANGDFILGGLFPGVGLFLLPPPLYHGLLTVFDVVSLLTLLCVTIALGRRLLYPPAHLATSYLSARSGEAVAILGLIALLMCAYFGLHGAEIAGGDEPAAAALPVSAAIATWLPVHTALPGIFWWLHAAALLGFMVLLPRSKHMHILTALPNLYQRDLAPVAIPRRQRFVRGERFGAGEITDFTRKDLLDAFSCAECGRCQQRCPAHATGKGLNPRQVVHNLKVNLLANGAELRQPSAVAAPHLPLIGAAADGTCAEEALWDCTTCGACLAACPLLIEHLPKIVELRRHLVQEESRFPGELLSLFDNLEQRSNPWGIAPGERGKWLASLGERPLTAESEVLFFVGCAGAFDNRAKQVTLAVARLLDHAGVKWGILGRDERCCGDSARRLGNEYLFEQAARENVALLHARGVKTIVTACPHCYTTLHNDYRAYGLDAEVIHHSLFLERLLAAGRLPVTARPAGSTLVHDSCYLGRHNRLYAAPRAVAAAATGTVAGEFPRRHDESFCCGAGGGRMWLEEQSGERINLARVKEGLAAGAATLCVSCPYCMTMFEDGLKDLGRSDVKVRDVAELLWEAVD